MQYEEIRRKMIEILICPTCNNPNQGTVTDFESGEVICSNCGIVILDRIEDYTHEERRAYSIEEVDNRSRIGAPSSLAVHDRGLCTIVGKANIDANGKIFDTANLARIEKLRRLNSWINVSKSSEKSLRRAFQKLDTLKDKLSLSDSIVEKSAYIFRKIQERHLVRGRTIDGMLSAAVYTACREMGASVTLKDIAAASNLTYKDISKNYRVLVFELDIKIPLIDPMKCIVKVANKLSIKEKTKKQAMNIMSEVVEREMTSGKVPMGLAASVLYLSCQITGEVISQAKIAEVSGTTEVTVRNRYKDLIQINSLYSRLNTIRCIPRTLKISGYHLSAET
jgi:transcription initiation factor TFIIB